MKPVLNWDNPLCIGDNMEGSEAVIYMMADRHQGTLYVGVAGDLPARVAEHRGGSARCLADRYGLKRLVWFDVAPTMGVAVKREQSLKRWRRDWKIALIKRVNPDWADLGPVIGLPTLDDLLAEER